MLEKGYQRLKPLLLYLTYFCMVCGMVMAMVYSGHIFSSFGFKMGTVGMFAFWITFFALKFDWFEDAIFLERRTALWIGLLSSVALLALQFYIRYTYGHLGLLNLPNLLPAWSYLETYQGYLIIARYVLVGILGYAIFNFCFADGDQVGYDFVEVTTYFTDSGFAYNQTVSDVKKAVWGYIVIGLATTIIPFLVSLNPLMILVFGFFLLRLLRHRSRKTLWIKRVCIWLVCLAAAAALVLFGKGYLPTLGADAIFGYQLETTKDGEQYYDIKAVCNETVATHITIPETYKGKPVRITDEKVFERCEHITYVKTTHAMAKYFPQAEELILTDGPTELTAPCSYKETNLKRIEIAYDAEVIKYGAFYGFNELEEIKLPGTIKHIEFNAFKGCTALTTIVLPNGLETIGEYAFSECTSLVALEIPESVTQIDGLAFGDCSALTTINIPNGITTIKQSTFNNCTSLTTIRIPDSVTQIDFYAFSRCRSLVHVEMSANIKVLGDGAFANCDNLTSLLLPTTIERVSRTAFYNTSVTIYYAGSAAEWSAVSKLDDDGHELHPSQYPLTVKYYSETEAEGCWHYGASGEILEW